MKTLHKVSAKNFLSLRDIEVSLGDLTVLVGPNGGGKTNFLSLFRFIGDIARTDLAPAIDLMGGGSTIYVFVTLAHVLDQL